MEKHRLHSAKSIRIGIQTNFIFLKHAYAPVPHFSMVSRVIPCGPIPHNHLARALMPRQPYSEAVKSDGEERFPLLP